MSPVTKSYTLVQLRQVAKAVILCERITAGCAPFSRQDAATDFCRSNVDNFGGNTPLGSVAGLMKTEGPWVGQKRAFSTIDQCPRDEMIRLVCPDKYKA